MKRSLVLICLLAACLFSCKKSSTNSNTAAQAATDDAAIQAYIKANNITAIKDPSGLYYSIITPGSGPYPTSTSNVTVNYTGKFLDGSTFDTHPSTYFALNGGVIRGWQIGIPHINTGGTILLLIPSALGYGAAGNGGGIPGNTVLVFTISLQGFN